MNTRLATTPGRNRRVSPIAFSSEQLLQANTDTRGTVQVILTRATPPTINVIPFRLPAMIQAAYRGTARPVRGCAMATHAADAVCAPNGQAPINSNQP